MKYKFLALAAPLLAAAPAAAEPANNQVPAVRSGISILAEKIGRAVHEMQSGIDRAQQSPDDQEKQRILLINLKSVSAGIANSMRDYSSKKSDRIDEATTKRMLEKLAQQPPAI